MASARLRILDDYCALNILIHIDQLPTLNQTLNLQKSPNFDRSSLNNFSTSWTILPFGWKTLSSLVNLYSKILYSVIGWCSQSNASSQRPSSSTSFARPLPNSTWSKCVCSHDACACIYHTLSDNVHIFKEAVNPGLRPNIQNNSSASTNIDSSSKALIDENCPLTH